MEISSYPSDLKFSIDKLPILFPNPFPSWSVKKGWWANCGGSAPSALKIYNYEDIKSKLETMDIKVDLKKLWKFSQNNIDFLKDIEKWLKTIEIIIDTKNYEIHDALIVAAVECIPEDPFSYETWDNWTKAINAKTGLKGKELYMPLRLILTGKEKGPELKNFLPLLDKKTLLRKFGKI